MKLKPPRRWNSSYRYYVGDVVWAWVPYTGDDPDHDDIDCRPVVLVERPGTPFEPWKVVTLTTKRGFDRPRVWATDRNGLSMDGFIWAPELTLLPIDALRQPSGLVDSAMAETVIDTCGLDEDQARALRIAATHIVRWVA
jgi:hypothetical protein